MSLCTKFYNIIEISKSEKIDNLCINLALKISLLSQKLDTLVINLAK